MNGIVKVLMTTTTYISYIMDRSRLNYYSSLQLDLE